MRMRERKFLKLDDCLDFFFFFFENHWTHDSSLEILGPILLAQKTFFFLAQKTINSMNNLNLDLLILL